MKDNNVREVKVTRVIDGDTFEGDLIVIQKPVKVIWNDIMFRLKGVDTPEVGEKGYQEATDFATKWLLNKNVDVKIHGYGGFNRYLVDVQIGDLPMTFNKSLLAFGFARKYK